MDLYYRELNPDSDKPALILLHGLFGSSVNLSQIGKHFSRYRKVIIPDLRNHGRSPHSEDVSYQAMAADLLNMLDNNQCHQVDIMGHSMGGKVAMWLALNNPDRVNHLVIADIAPVTYPNRFQTIIESMQTLDLSAVSDRQDADLHLQKYLDNASLRAYLLQNLLKLEGHWRWRINLQGLSSGVDSIMLFPQSSSEFEKPALFLKGEKSDYISETSESDLLNYFPLAQIEVIEETGHWLYAEKPDAFIEAMESFLPRYETD